MFQFNTTLLTLNFRQWLSSAKYSNNLNTHQPPKVWSDFTALRHNMYLVLVTKPWSSSFSFKGADMLIALFISEFANLKKHLKCLLCALKINPQSSPKLPPEGRSEISGMSWEVCLHRISPYTTNTAFTAGLFGLDGWIVPYVLSACVRFSVCVCV